MSLQWTAVATFLYAEVFLVLLLCVPFVSAARWQKIFKSRLVGLAVAYGNTVFIVLIVILVLLLLDALRETRKYDVAERVSLQSSPGALEHFHMKLFRAQRNLYLAGFALLLSFLLRRLVTLISQQAVLGASTEAFRKQAEGASQAARRYMEDNDALRKVPAMLGAWGGGGEEMTLGEDVHLLPSAPSTLREDMRPIPSVPSPSQYSSSAFSTLRKDVHPVALVELLQDEVHPPLVDAVPWAPGQALGPSQYGLGASQYGLGALQYRLRLLQCRLGPAQYGLRAPPVQTGILWYGQRPVPDLHPAMPQWLPVALRWLLGTPS
uniref:Endoplasmic reticulum transmembrane protein n=1 Tax=Apteryx owenii TaxID=8824 RepID=A0A8B9PSA1_APTOW